MTERIPQAVWEGSFLVFGVTVKCVVTETGQRLIEADSFHDLMAAMESGNVTGDPSEAEAFAKWQQTGATR